MKKLTYAFLLMFSAMTFMLSLSGTSMAADVSAGVVATEGGRLNIRASASSSAAVITSVNNKTNLAVYGQSGNWYKVEYANGKYGYCHRNYIKPNTAAFRAYVNTPGDVLNVRSGAGTSYSVKDKLSDGTAVTVISKGTSFHRVIYKGTNVGYVSAAYLKTNSTAAYSKIALTVPSYKQTDSRWKDVAIGTQGGTIGTIGCTTTALAMTESYRTKKSITPPDMKNKLTYTASGSLYWPVNYTTELVDSSNYLSKIYALLKKGKPVILGLKGNSQHWVVVTGHTANTASLSPGNFTINDPGSKTRTTLSSLLSVYPQIYKIAYYN